MTEIRYPLEITNVVRKQTFYINSHLSLADEKEAEPPLMTFGHFSRYEFVIINEEKKAATANINLKDIRGVIRRSKYLLNKHYDAENDEKNITAALSPAYTVKFTSGRMAGKTPAEILSENSQNAKMLEDQKSFLASHLGRYPKNQIQIDAITDAQNLFSEGKLNAQNVVKSDTRKLYLAAMRPLTRRKVPSDILAHFPENVRNSVSFVYEIMIQWTLGMPDYPVTVAIVNYYAPVEKKPDGTLNVHKKEKDNTTAIMNTMKLSVDEWMDALDDIESDIRRFRMLYASKCYKAAMNAETANRAARTPAPQAESASYQGPQPQQEMPYQPIQQTEYQQPQYSAPQPENFNLTTDQITQNAYEMAERLNISTDNLPF